MVECNHEQHELEDLKWLNEYTPCFRIDANSISVITEPNEFYEKLKSIFSTSRTRVLISSLYLGTGDLEQDLVNSIEESLKANSQSRVKVLLDHARGLRGVKNSKTMIEPLLKQYEDRVNLYLYHTPNLRGIIKKVLPERTNETIGVMHMKIYIGDNDLIISGANLSHDYFTNRQDRYIHIKNCEKLCDFFESIIDSLGNFSFAVNKNGDVIYLNENHLEHPFNGRVDDFSNALSERLTTILNQYKASSNVTSESESELDGKNSTHQQQTSAFVYPLIQISDCSIKIDEMVTEKLFASSPARSVLYLAVGYFNLTNNYIEKIVKSSLADFKILLSSPEANGFFGAAGFSNNIPNIYSYLEEEFFNYYNRSSQDKRISLHEYQRDNWTYHAKGLWYYPDGKLPSFTIIGSSNYGYRSVYRDVEIQLLIKSKNENFQKQIDSERKNLFDHTILVNSEILTNHTRSLPKWLKLFARTFRSFF